LERTVSIIGAGPAGLSASIQLSRAGIPHFIFEKDIPGGLLKNGNLVENYPGIPEPLSGRELADRMVRQFISYSPDLINDEVLKVGYGRYSRKFKIVTREAEYSSEYIIAASGTIPKVPDIVRNTAVSLQQYIYSEIFSIKEYTGRKILIAGAGDCAFDYSLSLSSQNDIEIIHRGTVIKALPVLWEKATSMPGINYYENTEITGIRAGKTKPLSVMLNRPGRSVQIEYDLFVYAIGRTPADRFLIGMESEDKDMLVKRFKLIFAGDMANGSLRQAVTAAGDGMAAAMRIIQMIREG
jgi:thioredoxin reductase (NADPH)